MALVAAICSQCGGKIQIDDSKESGVCPNCGTSFVTEKIIHQNITNNNFAGANVTVKMGPELSNILKLARRAKDNNNAAEAIKYYSQILENDTNNGEALFYKAYFTATTCSLAEMSSAVNLLWSETEPAIPLFASSASSEEFNAAISQFVNLCSVFISNACDNYIEFIDLDDSFPEFKDRYSNSIGIFILFMQKILSLSKNDIGDTILNCYQSIFELNTSLISKIDAVTTKVRYSDGSVQYDRSDTKKASKSLIKNNQIKLTYEVFEWAKFYKSSNDTDNLSKAIDLSNKFGEDDDELGKMIKDLDPSLGFISVEGKKFKEKDLSVIKEKISSLSEDKQRELCNTKLKDPAVCIGTSLFCIGSFLIGTTGSLIFGLIKLLLVVFFIIVKASAGGYSSNEIVLPDPLPQLLLASTLIVYFADVFTISSRAKNKNFSTVKQIMGIE